MDGWCVAIANMELFLDAVNSKKARTFIYLSKCYVLACHDGYDIKQ
jgi:hypothetical protein